jgi:hypothetical protein
MKKVRINEESNIIHTFSSSFAPAANNEADRNVVNEAEAADVTNVVNEAEADDATKEALTSATDDNDDTNETDATDKVSATDYSYGKATNEVDATDATKETSTLDDDLASVTDEVDAADATKEALTLLDDDHDTSATDDATETDATAVLATAYSKANEATNLATIEATNEANAVEANDEAPNEADAVEGNNKATNEANHTVEANNEVSTLDGNSTDNDTSDEASTTNDETSTEEELNWKDYEKDWDIIPILLGEHRGAKLGMVLAGLPFTKGGRMKHCRVARFIGADSLGHKLGVQRGDWICKTVRSNPVLLQYTSVLQWIGGFPLVFFLLRSRQTDTAPSQAAPNYASPTIARRLFNASSTSVQVTPAVHQPAAPAPSTGQRRKRNLFTGNLLPGIVGMLSSPGQQNERNEEFATEKDRRFESYKHLQSGKRPAKFSHLQGRTMRRKRALLCQYIFGFARTTHPEPLDNKGTSTAGWPTMSFAGIFFDQIRPSNKNGGAYPERKERTWPIERCAENTRPKEMILVAVRDHEFLEEFKAKMRSIVTSDFTSTDEFEIVFAFDPESVNRKLDGGVRTQLKGSLEIYDVCQDEARHVETPTEKRGNASSSSPPSEPSLGSPDVDDLDGIVFS